MILGIESEWERPDDVYNPMRIVLNAAPMLSEKQSGQMFSDYIETFHNSIRLHSTFGQFK